MPTNPQTICEYIRSLVSGHPPITLLNRQTIPFAGTPLGEDLNNVLASLSDLPLNISTHAEAITSTYLLAHELHDARREIAALSYYSTAIIQTRMDLWALIEDLEQTDNNYYTRMAIRG